MQALSDIRGEFVENNTGLAGTDQQVLDGLKRSKEGNFTLMFSCSYILKGAIILVIILIELKESISSP